MKRTAFRLLAINSLVFARVAIVGTALLLVSTAQARTRPRYGDTLRAETHAVVMSSDPSPEALAGLVFETLVTIDDNGNPQPALAISWTSQNNGEHWEFALHPNVMFHDGTPLTSAAVVRALSQVSGQPWQVRAGSNSVVFESGTPQPDLPALLSLPQFAIIATSAQGETIGTGPFRLDQHSGASISLTANDDYWGGRPFVDSLQLLVSRAPTEQMADFSFDRADVAECPADQLRRAQQERLRLDVSRPEETLFLVFDSAKPELRDVRLRQAIALAVDRAAIHDVIFQHEGEIASGLLPNWLGGYEFLFDSTQDAARARQLRGSLGGQLKVTVAYEPGDAAARLIAERVALNAHDTGLNMQAQPIVSGPSDIRIRRLSLSSLDPEAALSSLIDSLGITARANIASADSPYVMERAALETYNAIPLVHLPRITVLGNRVRDWSSSPRGEWRLDRVWLAPRATRTEVRP
jgi:ABC-type transport system substrate-binding protein